MWTCWTTIRWVIHDSLVWFMIKNRNTNTYSTPPSLFPPLGASSVMAAITTRVLLQFKQGKKKLKWSLWEMFFFSVEPRNWTGGCKSEFNSNSCFLFSSMQHVRRSLFTWQKSVKPEQPRLLPLLNIHSKTEVPSFHTCHVADSGV